MKKGLPAEEDEENLAKREYILLRPLYDKAL